MLKFWSLSVTNINTAVMVDNIIYQYIYIHVSPWKKYHTTDITSLLQLNTLLSCTALLLL